jgi:hypothetical protein
VLIESKNRGREILLFTGLFFIFASSYLSEICFAKSNFSFKAINQIIFYFWKLGLNKYIETYSKFYIFFFVYNCSNTLDSGQRVANKSIFSVYFKSSAVCSCNEKRTYFVCRHDAFVFEAEVDGASVPHIHTHTHTYDQRKIMQVPSSKFPLILQN